jgi:DNA-binding beta-propeller fold protein YncE
MTYRPPILLLLATLFLPTTVNAQAPPFLLQWGGLGTGDDQMQTPVGVAIGPDGSVYVSDSNLSRVQKFTSDGAFILKWGSSGSAPGQFGNPAGIAVDASGNVYVVDYAYDRVQKFTSNGVFIATWGGLGVGPGEFSRPTSIAVDAVGNVYVTDSQTPYPSNARIEKFTSTGVFLAQWSAVGADGVCIGTHGGLYVAENNGPCQVQKFSASGSLLLQWGDCGLFPYPVRTAADAMGRIYVVDNAACTVKVFTENGLLLAAFGTPGHSPGQFANPIGIAVDASGNVYVADANNSRIEKFGQVPTAAIGITWGHLKTLYR